MILLKVGFSIYVLDFIGGRTRTRTLDPLIKSWLHVVSARADRR